MCRPHEEMIYFVVSWRLRDPTTLVCCSGWRQQGDECTTREFVESEKLKKRAQWTSLYVVSDECCVCFFCVCVAVCEGEQACLENEICLSPGVCRCPPGYYGAQCKTRELNSHNHLLLVHLPHKTFDLCVTECKKHRRWHSFTSIIRDSGDKTGFWWSQMINIYKILTKYYKYNGFSCI